MAAGKAVWGIDIGQCALKAIKLRPAGEGKVEVVAFDIIEHPKILSQPDAEPDELIKAAIEKFASRNDWQGDQFVIGVPGQQTFARFCKLPPVEDKKKLPALVEYEAGQQIPFDMDDVVWDYQVFTAPDQPDMEVGIFAMRKDLIRKHIDYFSGVGIAPSAIQTIPAALYNFVRFDRFGAEETGATVIIDVGAQNTDLIIVEKNSAWMRNIPLGGNNFTDALVKAFKLSFPKAENLKRTAATHKYARQIFQSMRPIFQELTNEVQRSLGFYSSTHRDVELTRVLAVGNAFLLTGLQKYLENNLSIGGGVEKLEKFNNIVPSATINAPQFTDNVLSFGAAYGLALQGLGLGAIAASMLPTELARVAVWKKKRPYFVAAAACLGVASLLPWTRNFLDSQALASNQDAIAKKNAIVSEAKSFRQRFSEVSKNTGEQEESIKKLIEFTQKNKLIVPRLVALVNEALPEVPGLDKAQTPDEFKKLVTSDPNRYARTKRKQLVIESFKIEFTKNIDNFVPTNQPSEDYTSAVGTDLGMMSPSGPGRFGGSRGPVVQVQQDSGGGDGAPGFYVYLRGRLLYGNDRSEVSAMMNEEFFKNIRTLGSRPGLGFYVMDEDPKGSPEKSNPRLGPLTRYYGNLPTVPVAAPKSPAGGRPGDEADAEAKQYADPVTGEDMRTDWRFDVGFKVKLGEKPAAPAAAEAPK